MDFFNPKMTVVLALVLVSFSSVIMEVHALDLQVEEVEAGFSYSSWLGPTPERPAPEEFVVTAQDQDFATREISAGRKLVQTFQIKDSINLEEIWVRLAPDNQPEEVEVRLYTCEDPAGENFEGEQFFAETIELPAGNRREHGGFLRLMFRNASGAPVQLPAGGYGIGFAMEAEGPSLHLRRPGYNVESATGGKTHTGSVGQDYTHSSNEIIFAVLRADVETPEPEKSVYLPSKQARPSIYLAAEEDEHGLRTLADLRHDIEADEASATLWKAMLDDIEGDFESDPVIVEPGGHVSWGVAHNASQRIMRNALAAAVTKEERYREQALMQIAVVLDPILWWPENWRDTPHGGMNVDLRAPRLALAMALAYDWMHDQLSEAERRWLIDQIDERAIRPYLKDMEQGTWWRDGTNNWTTVIVGGFGMVGMALGDSHPKSEYLVELSEPRMRNYLDVLGDDGSFNETPFYANALRQPVDYFAALRYHRGGELENDPLADGRLGKAARWMMYVMLPPGRVMRFGDCDDAEQPLPFFPRVAQAGADGMIQWSYLNQPVKFPFDTPRRDLVSELLGYDGGLEPEFPGGELPLGRAFGEHGKIISSRASWDPDSTPSVAYGKAGREGHGANDVGQFCLDGYGEELIIALGMPAGGYPPDYFNGNREEYYNASTIGQNVLMFDGREQNKNYVAEILEAEFDDELGGLWRLDLTPVYDGAEKVQRTVVHLLPDVAVVLDEARLEEESEISLRWHTANRAEPSDEGAFTVKAGDVRLAAQVSPTDDSGVSHKRGEHAYEEPYDKTRHGEPLRQPNESFIKTTARERRISLLTLFAVQRKDAPSRSWQFRDGKWAIETPEGRVTVEVNGSELIVEREDGQSRIIGETR